MLAGRVFASLSVGFLTQIAAAAASPWESFEAPQVGAAWSTAGGGELSASTDRWIHGARSLKWDWEAPDPVLAYSGDLGDPTGYVISFSFWVYLEDPIPEASLRVEFLEGDGILTAFDFGLNFSGWRTAFVPYRDMEGSAASTMDSMRLRLQGAAVPESGHLYIDQVVFSKVMDSRHQYADLQVPFVREGLDLSHWEPRIEERGRDPLEAHPVDEEAITAAADLADSVEAALIGEAAVYPWMVDAVEAEIAAFGLERTEDGVRGNHIFYNSYPGMAYPTDLRASVEGEGLEHDFREYGTLMLKIAGYYHRSGDTELKTRLSDWFLLMAEHLLDQGWADGSNQGCIHHFGYQAREYIKAHFLMREVLEDAGILDPARRAVQWYTRAGQLLDPFIEPNLDYYNTLSLGQMLGLLMETDPARRASWMKAYQNGLSRTLATVIPGDGLGLKPDGTAFHHNGHYPAYAVGAFNTLGFLFEVLRETPFAPGMEAREALHDALLAARVYSQRYDWPMGLSGRHPFSGNINSLKGAFAALAAYPHPGSGLTPDPEMSAAYLRLWGSPAGDLGEAIRDAGYQPESLEGFWSYPFANLAIARGDGWMASMKGYSTYVWSSEIYTNDNRYGRYQSNGTLEILLDDGRLGSGFRQSGWDWNRLPGTTAIHLPLDELESPRSGTLMLRSDETFAGAATHTDRTGIFGMILNEPFFDNDLKARKSVTMLGDRLVALGSGIQSANTTHPTETTLFQVALTSPDSPQYIGSTGTPVTGLDRSGVVPANNGFWIQDPVGTGYWVAPGNLLRWHRKTQASRHNKTRAPTEGDFATAWLHHGNAPRDADYHFTVIPGATTDQLDAFSTRMSSPETAPYAVLAHSTALHAVRDNTRETVYISAFEAGGITGLPLLKEVSDPVLIVLEPSGDNLHISLSNPDLKPTSEGHILTPNHILLEGLWEPAIDGEFLYWHENSATRVVVPTRAGATTGLRLDPAAHRRPFTDAERAVDITPTPVRQANPSSTVLTWEPAAGTDRLGWVIEKLSPDSGRFEPKALLDADTLRWQDPDLSPGNLASYRLTEWTADGLGPSGAAVPLYIVENLALSYDFTAMTSLEGFEEDGWIPSGIQSAEEDLRLGLEGLHITDNDPSSPAALERPLPDDPAGSVEAELGVFGLSNFFVTLSLLEQGRTLMAIQLETRTEGYIEGRTVVPFSDTSWDKRDGPPRRLSLQWEAVSDDEYSIRATFHDKELQPAAILTEVYAIDQLPDTVRLHVGYGSAVRRGGLVKSLAVRTSSPPSSLPWSAMEAAPRYRLHPSAGALWLSWDPHPSPADYGFTLMRQSSSDLINWTPPVPVDTNPGKEDGYRLPGPESNPQFHRFLLKP